MKLLLLVIISLPKNDCVSKKWENFQRCSELLMTNCVTPDSRPSIQYTKKFERSNNDDCYDIYLSTASFDVEPLKEGK